MDEVDEDVPPWMALDANVAPVPAAVPPVLPVADHAPPVPPANAVLAQALHQQMLALQQQVQQLQQPPPANGLTNGLPPIPPTPSTPPRAVAWEPALATAIGTLPLAEVLKAIAPTMAEASGVPVITRSLLLTRRALVRAGGAEVAVSETRGTDRLAAVEYLAASLSAGEFRAPLSAVGVNQQTAVAALSELFDLVAPQTDVPMGQPVQSYAEHARAVRELEKEEKAMSVAAVQRKMAMLSAKAGVLCPELGSMLCPSQLRTLHEELVKDERFPSHKSLEPDKLLLYDGADGLAPSRPKKDEEQVADDAADAQEFRARVDGMVHSVGLVTVGEANGDAVYAAALRMGQALKRATLLSTLLQLRGALRAAFTKARRLCNQGTTSATLADGYLAAAAEIDRRNDDAGDPCLALAALPAAQVRTQHQLATSGAMTPADLAKLVNDAVAKAAKEALAKAGEKRKGDEVTFQRMKGGNPANPHQCTNKEHAKGQKKTTSYCKYSHAGF